MLLGVRVYIARVCVRVSLSTVRDNPLTQAWPLSSSFASSLVALLPAFCEKTAFSTLEVATRRGLNLSPSQQNRGTDSLSRGRTLRDAPDATATALPAAAPEKRRNREEIFPLSMGPVKVNRQGNKMFRKNYYRNLEEIEAISCRSCTWLHLL